MRRVVRKTVVYICGVCRTEYGTAKQAKNCETRPLENKKFKLGDFVGGREKHTCDRRSKNNDFFPKGRIIKIVGPQLVDKEYSAKWLGGELRGSHVFMYEVEYKCPCGAIRSHRFYSPELKLVKNKN